MKHSKDEGQQGPSTATANAEDRAMLDKAQEIMRLFQDAIRLGYSITFTPEQLQALITICESGYLVKKETHG